MSEDLRGDNIMMMVYDNNDDDGNDNVTFNEWIFIKLLEQCHVHS